MTIEMVALCRMFDIKSNLGPFFAERHPHIRLVNPDEVSDPDRIRHGIFFRPGPEDFAPFPKLRFLCTGAAGVDGVIGHPGLTPQMTVVRTEMPQQAQMMAAFAAYYVTGWHRRMWAYPDQQRDRLWEAVNLTSPHGFPVGVLGYGNIGSKVAEVLASMGYPVTALARTPRPDAQGVRVVSGADGLSEIAQTCRAIVNILPLTEQTAGILKAGFFAQMAPDTMLIQIGRGGHLVEADLLAGLERGTPARAALDVFDREPLPPEHPFWAHPQIMMTPHIGSFAPRDLIVDWIAKALDQWERGERPQGYVDHARGY